MRDLALLLILGGVSVYALFRPWVGAVAWAVVSLMSPHVEFGYAAANWPVATGVAACTLIGVLTTRDRWNPLVGSPSQFLLAFTIWICITLPFSYYVDFSLPLWERSMKIYLMLFVTLALLNTKDKLTVFIWANVAAIGYYGLKGGAFTLLTGGNYRVWGTGGFIFDNNSVALATITIVPLLRYLQQQMTGKWMRLGMTGALLLCMVMALGTQSRGALLGMSAMGLMLWWKGSNKLLWGLLIAVIAAVALSFMPEAYWERMRTIRTYKEDSSAMGRVNAWWMTFNLAKDNFFGGGFMIYKPPLFEKYAPDPDDLHAAHSIYFQVLGEHGFIGLALFLGIGVATWMTCRSLIAAGRRDPTQKWAADLGSMIQVSMIGYAVTGAFLSLAYFDLPYNVMVMAVVAKRLVRASQPNGVPGDARRPESLDPARQSG